jgi:hypothetical protein
MIIGSQGRYRLARALSQEESEILAFFKLVDTIISVIVALDIGL